MIPPPPRCTGRGAVLLAFGLLAASSVRATDETCVSSSCHTTIVAQKSIHAATESCTSCHESTATPHPQKGKKTFKLAQEPPELCYACHDAFGKKADVHPPVKDGMCTTCHDPHATAEPKLLAQPAKDLCAACHEDQTKAKHPHGPVSAGDCAACHTPHESDLKPLLVKKSEELCLGCHVDVQDVLKKPHVHAAIEGGCTTCHNPHGTDFPKLLADAGPAVCTACHTDVGEKIEKAVVVHGAIKSASGCAGCHSPHASDEVKLLLQPQKTACLSCHAKVIPPTATVLHGPVKDGACAACHDPHASSETALLVKSFPADPYVAYTDQAYALCFSCHKRDLVQYPDTSFATGFRDGERNLHYVHVNKPKGRSCILCHEVHGGTSPKLVAASVPFGRWNLPLKFVATETGGSCAPGCHKPQSYDRKAPFKRAG